MSLKFFEKLSQNFIELLNDKDDYNVIIEVENKEKSLTAHSNIEDLIYLILCRPYKKILDKQLWEDINLPPPERPYFTGKTNFLTTYSTKNIPYKFELILRGTKDGFAPQTFWNICHGHARTVVVAKVKRMDEIIGGYNPLAWDSAC
ncbi:hypothetical protein Glove_71g147 [Diversispora epigaea]|uniref:TLDc domain-containing protein n=1 Tax=Diversispora epigaea TaxID=1348612 RepID=A0A397JAK8_9GLOM|nr:hypothetical protein Glove_71g147 [Diversispora epigaea]